MSAPTKFDEAIHQILMSYKRYPYGTPEAPHITGDKACAAIKHAVDVYVIGEDMDVSLEALGIVDQDNVTLEESIHLAIGRGMNLHRELSREALWGKSKDNASKEKTMNQCTMCSGTGLHNDRICLGCGGEGEGDLF